MKLAIVGGGAGGIGAASASKRVNRDLEVDLFTAYEDVAYSPCGIPYAHAGEVENFEDLFLRSPEAYEEAGIHVHYETQIEALDLSSKTLTTADGGEHSWDRLILATGFHYAPLEIPGAELDGVHQVKNIRRAMEFDPQLDDIERAVVFGANHISIEMVHALRARDIETTLVDRASWLLDYLTDPDVIAPIQTQLESSGAEIKLGTIPRSILGEDGRVSGVVTDDEEIPCELVIHATNKTPETRLGSDAGLRTGTTGGFAVNRRMRTNDDHVYAVGDCAEVMHGILGIPVNGLTGSHAYSMGKVAGMNVAGRRSSYEMVHVPWGFKVGDEAVGGAGLGEHHVRSLGIPHLIGRAKGISRARYYPGSKPILVKVVAEKGSHRLLGGSVTGSEGVKERADFLSFALRKESTLEDLAWMENLYSPPIGALKEPMALAAADALESR